MDAEQAKLKFGQRIQRCYGCFIAYHVKDMWLSEDASYYCQHCKEDSMIHFDVYSADFDFTQLPSMQPEPSE